MTDRAAIDRRTMLGVLAAGAFGAPFVASGAAGAAAQTAAGTAASAPLLDRVGVQLYTVRTEMEKDVEATLARVAEIGYKEVEFAGYFDHTPQQIRAMLDRHGLTAPATHIAYTNLGDGWAKVLEDSAVIGHQFIVIPFLEENVRQRTDDYRTIAEALNRGAEQTKAAGMRFAYHNHHFEFVPDASGRTGFDLLVAECSPDVLFEIDLFWATVAGQDPVALFERLRGRVPLVHVKDMAARPAAAPGADMVAFERAFAVLTDVGKGTIDWRRIFARADVAGIEHYFVEHDEPASPFDSITASYEYLTGTSGT